MTQNQPHPSCTVALLVYRRVKRAGLSGSGSPLYEALAPLTHAMSDFVGRVCNICIVTFRRNVIWMQVGIGPAITSYWFAGNIEQDAEVCIGCDRTLGSHPQIQTKNKKDNKADGEQRLPALE